MGDLSITWHDAPELGHAIELHQDNDFFRGFFGQVSQAAQDWDGHELIQLLG
jgi:hypothetical protein